MKTPIYSKNRQTFINLDSVFNFCSFQLTLESGVLRSVDLKTKLLSRNFSQKRNKTEVRFIRFLGEVTAILFRD